MTNQQGAPEALRPITRYEVVDCIDSKHVPAVIPNKDGPWVRYEDHAAALVEAQQPAPSAAAFDEHGFRDWVLRNLPKGSVIGNGEWWADHLTSWAKRFVKAAPQPSTTPQADSAQAEPLQAFDSPRAKALMRAWEEGWAACRDAEYVGEEAQNDAFNSSNTLTLCIAEDQQLPAPQADSQPAPVEVADAMADSQYLAGVSAGWNAANADDPNAALQKLHESRAGYLKPLSAARAPADSQPAPQGETNVQLDTDSNHSTPGQQWDVAGPVALGQPMGDGPDQAAGDPSAQGDKLLTVAERNIRSFLRSAVFKSESDREAALNCVDVLWEAAHASADSVLEDAALPMQPICVASDGIVRFNKNRMVNDLYEFSQPRGFGLNEMARRDYTQEERMQFAQLIGYSVSGYGSLSYASPESVEKADAIADLLIAARKQGANHD